MTGGLQEQVTDGENWFGVGLTPSSKAVIGSLNVPWIYEDRINEDDFVNALEKIYNMSKPERDELGRQGKLHVQKNYNFEDFQQKWVKLMTDINTRYGSWETRQNYTPWEVSTL
jgi:glycosyltransferase involved in cell wall biosynthesis